MPEDRPHDGKPGTTEQSPRWEGPAENRPRGYLPAEDDPYNEKDAAGETLKHPDRQTLADATATKNNAPPPRDRGDEEFAGHPDFSQDAAKNDPPKGIGNSEPVDDVDEKTRHSDGVNPPGSTDR